MNACSLESSARILSNNAPTTSTGDMRRAANASAMRCAESQVGSTDIVLILMITSRASYLGRSSQPAQGVE
jgi:hypothetical protein